MGTSNTLLSVMTNTGHVNTRWTKIMLLSVPYKRGTILKDFVITGLGSTAGGGPRSGAEEWDINHVTQCAQKQGHSVKTIYVITGLGGTAREGPRSETQ